MKENKNIWWLVALASMVVIATAIYVWQGSGAQPIENRAGDIPDVETEQRDGEVGKSESELDIVITSSETQVATGGQVEAKISLVPKRSMNLDAIDLVIKYDPSSWQYLGLVSPEGAPELTAKKVDSARGLITLSYYVSVAEGYELSEAVDLVGLKMVAKKSGESKIEVFVSDTGKERTSRIVEAGTSKLIPFAVSSLAVKVEE